MILTEEFTRVATPRSVGLVRQTDTWIRGEMTRMARQLRLSKLPMEEADFSFFGFGDGILRRKGVRGQDLTHAVYRVIQELFIRAGTGQPGPIYNYPDYYRETGRPFDWFFRYLFVQKSRNLSRDSFYGEKMREPGFENWEIQGEDPSSPTDRDDSDRILREDIPAVLQRQKGGDAFVVIWRSSLDGMNLEQMAESLRRFRVKGINSGVSWNVGTVKRYRDRTLSIARDYLESRGFHLEDFLGLEVGG